jgi:hypothetical protein
MIAPWSRLDLYFAYFFAPTPESLVLAFLECVYTAWDKTTMSPMGVDVFRVAHRFQVDPSIFGEDSAIFSDFQFLSNLKSHLSFSKKKELFHVTRHNQIVDGQSSDT